MKRSPACIESHRPHVLGDQLDDVHVVSVPRDHVAAPLQTQQQERHGAAPLAPQLHRGDNVDTPLVVPAVARPAINEQLDALLLLGNAAHSKLDVEWQMPNITWMVDTRTGIQQELHNGNGGGA